MGMGGVWGWVGYRDGCCYVYSIQVGVRAWLGVKVGACALLGEKGTGGEGSGEMGDGRWETRFRV
jgi:hypothetical protein